MYGKCLILEKQANNSLSKSDHFCWATSSFFEKKPRGCQPSCLVAAAGGREEVFMEGPLEPNMGPSLADVLLCTFESTNAGFSSFPLRKLLSWE
jgi:hypothetical protein